LDEALGLAIGFRRVGLGAQVLDFGQAQCRVTTGSEAGAVVGHDAIDYDTMALNKRNALKRKLRQERRFSSGKISE
jgi:hypothetical protein